MPVLFADFFEMILKLYGGVFLSVFRIYGVYDIAASFAFIQPFCFLKIQITIQCAAYRTHSVITTVCAFHNFPPLINKL